MSIRTKKDLRNLMLYQVYTRNHTKEGTFKAFNSDLDRIKELGTDVVYFLPIHPIGQKNKKGSLGCPYSIQDYRKINPEYGTMEDFIETVEEVHNRDMLVMIDVVYNHTSYDSVLLQEHPEYFYKKNGEFANRVGDWWDITDLDYTVDEKLWDELIDTLLFWAKSGVDGFRFDVASFLPLAFLERMESTLRAYNPDIILLSESVHGGFLRYIRAQGFECLSESEIYRVFDMAYDYDVHPYFEDYLNKKVTFKRYLEELIRQDEIYPDNYVKLRNLENHDQVRFAAVVNNDIEKINNWLGLTFFSKGATMIYAGQERLDNNRPSLFDKDDVNWDGPDISETIKVLASITKDKIFSYGNYDIYPSEKEVYVGSYENDEKKVFGVFNVNHEQGYVRLGLEDQLVTNLITGNKLQITNGVMAVQNEPVIFEVKK